LQLKNNEEDIGKEIYAAGAFFVLVKYYVNKAA